VVPKSIIEQVDEDEKEKKKKKKAKIAKELTRRRIAKEKKVKEEEVRQRRSEEEARKAEEDVHKEKEEASQAEEEARLEEERLQKRAQWKRAKKVRKGKSQGKGTEYSLKASAFIASVYTGLTEFPPDISPIGDFVSDLKWSVDMEEDGLSVHARIKKGLLSEPFQVTCRYRRVIYRRVITLKQCNTLFTRVGKEASSKDRFHIFCIVADNLPEGVKEALEVFNHPNFSPLIYEVSDQQLYFPPNDEKLKMFIGWFSTDEKNKTLEELVTGVADEDGSFTKESLSSDLGLNEDDVDRLIEFLLGQQKIVDVDRKSFAFVK